MLARILPNARRHLLTKYPRQRHLSRDTAFPARWFVRLELTYNFTRNVVAQSHFAHWNGHIAFVEIYRISVCQSQGLILIEDWLWTYCCVLLEVQDIYHEMKWIAFSVDTWYFHLIISGLTLSDTEEKSAKLCLGVVHQYKYCLSFITLILSSLKYCINK